MGSNSLVELTKVNILGSGNELLLTSVTSLGGLCLKLCSVTAVELDECSKSSNNKECRDGNYVRHVIPPG